MATVRLSSPRPVEVTPRHARLSTYKALAHGASLLLTFLPASIRNLHSSRPTPRASSGSPSGLRALSTPATSSLLLLTQTGQTSPSGRKPVSFFDKPTRIYTCPLLITVRLLQLNLIYPETFRMGFWQCHSSLVSLLTSSDNSYVDLGNVT